MNYQESYNLILNYLPKNEQEKEDKKMFLNFLDIFKEKAYKRQTLAAHFTSSAMIFNETFDKVLFAYHNIYDSFSWVGGHCDGDFDFYNVSLKEAYEETSIPILTPFSKDIISIEILPVEHHVKKANYN